MFARKVFYIFEDASLGECECMGMMSRRYLNEAAGLYMVLVQDVSEGLSAEDDADDDGIDLAESFDGSGSL